MKRFALYSCVLLILAACSSEPADSQHVIGFYNLENLFDTVDDPQKNDEDFLPDGRNSWTEDKYQEKLANMAQVIEAMADRLRKISLAQASRSYTMKVPTAVE